MSGGGGARVLGWWWDPSCPGSLCLGPLLQARDTVPLPLFSGQMCIECPVWAAWCFRLWIQPCLDGSNSPLHGSQSSWRAEQETDEDRQTY